MLYLKINIITQFLKLTPSHLACNQAPFFILYLSSTTFLNNYQKLKRTSVSRRCGQLSPRPLSADCNTKHCGKNEWLGRQIGLVTEPFGWNWTPWEFQEIEYKKPVVFPHICDREEWWRDENCFHRQQMSAAVKHSTARKSEWNRIKPALSLSLSYGNNYLLFLMLTIPTPWYFPCHFVTSVWKQFSSYIELFSVSQTLVIFVLLTTQLRSRARARVCVCVCGWCKITFSCFVFYQSDEGFLCMCRNMY